MEFYVCIFILLVYFVLRFSNGGDTPRNRVLFVRIVTWTMFLISGFRHRYVGNDTINYLTGLDLVQTISWRELLGSFIDMYVNPNLEIGKDPAMLLFSKIVSMISGNYTVFILITSAIFLYPFAKFMIRNAQSINELLFGYLMFTSMYYGFLPNSAIRQSFAIAILLWGISDLQKNKKAWRFFFFVLFASFFHKSAAIGILYLAAVYFKRQSVLFMLGLPAFLFMLLFYEPVGQFMSSQSEIYNMYSGGFYAQRSRPFVSLVLFLGLYLMSWYRYGAVSRKAQDRLQFNILSIGTLLTVTFVPLILLDPSMIRITGYFVLPMSLLVPRCMNEMRKRIVLAVYVVCIMLFLYKAMKSGIDYALFWQQMAPPENPFIE